MLAHPQMRVKDLHQLIAAEAAAQSLKSDTEMVVLSLVPALSCCRRLSQAS